MLIDVKDLATAIKIKRVNIHYMANKYKIFPDKEISVKSNKKMLYSLRSATELKILAHVSQISSLSTLTYSDFYFPQEFTDNEFYNSYCIVSYNKCIWLKSFEDIQSIFNELIEIKMILDINKLHKDLLSNLENNLQYKPMANV